jgi:Xaa-Pro aminopeptidase
MSDHPRIAPEEYKGRIDALRRAAETYEVDCILAYAHSLRPGNVFYFTGYVPFNGSALCVLTEADCQLFLDAAWDRAAACHQTWLPEALVTATTDYARSASEILGRATARIGVVGMDLLPANVYISLKAALPEAEYVDLTPVVAALRARKSEAEVALLREAGVATSAGVRAFEAHLKQGVSEMELAVAAEAAMKLGGAERLTFPTNLGSGPRMRFVSPVPTARVVKDHEFVLLDCGGVVKGYCGDVSRTAVLGEPSASQRRLLTVLLEMYDESCPMLRPGVEMRAVHSRAGEVASAGGFECPESTGHSIGCENHELPVFADDAVEVLEPNMVVAFEPALTTPDLGGVRVEDTFLITESGAELLTASPIQRWV